MRVIVSRAPTRLCLVGGGTDVDPYAAERQGVLINVAIDRYHTVHLVPRVDRQIWINALGCVLRWSIDDLAAPAEDSRFDLLRAVLRRYAMQLKSGAGIGIAADVSDSSGLGTSASVTVAFLGALRAWLGLPVQPDEVAREAYEVEVVELGWAGGKQDQWAAAHGGLNVMRFGPGQAVRVDALQIDESARVELRRHLTVAYVGGKRKSAALQQGLRVGMASQQRVQAFDTLKRLALRATDQLQAQQWKAAGATFDEGWQAKKRSNPQVSTPRIDALYAGALSAGAWGGKLVGAGQAGYLMLLCPPERQAAVRAEFVRHAALPFAFDFDLDGLCVTTRGQA